MNSRRILLVSPGWPRNAYANGIVSYVDIMQHAFTALGNEARIATFAAAPGGEDATLISGAFSRLGTLQRLASGAAWKLAAPLTGHIMPWLDMRVALRAAYRKWPFDLVEIEESYGMSSWAARAVAAAAVVVRLHGPWFLNAPARGVPRDAAFNRLVAQEGRAIASAEGLTAPSRDVLEQVRRHYGLALADAAVIPNPGPSPKPEERWLPEAAVPRLIAFIGRFDRHKGGDLVVDAFVQLASSHPDLRLEMAGSDDGVVDDAGRRWSFGEYLQERVPPALHGAITLLGRVAPEKLVDLRRRASLVVFASRYENFPITLLESMSQGCPLVCADAGSVTEIVEDERNALVFRAGDAGSMAQRIAVLLDHPERAAALAAQALEDYRSRFLPEQIARLTLDYYEQVLARRAGAKNV